MDFSQNDSRPDRKIRWPLSLEECDICGKEIHDEEWVANCGSCDECFYRMWDSYVQEHPEAAKRFPEGD